MPKRRGFVVALWLAFVLQGTFYAIVAPMWDGFDEPAHLAYILFVDEHGRPPGFHEPSFPRFFVDENRFLPSMVGHGAPSFTEWRAMPAAERDRDRAIADQLARDPNRYRVYMSGNYERQQGPLFYCLAALPGFFLRQLTLPKLLVAMRLFCVLVASAAVPIAARMFNLLGGERALWIGLPLLALAPNTPFTFDRLGNEALAFPLATAVAVELVAIAKGRGGGHLAAAGLLTAAGIFTRITFLTMLPALVVALIISRDKRALSWMQAVAIPSAAAAIMLAWNKAGSGHFSGIIEQSYRGPVTRADLGAAIRLLRSIPLTSEFVHNHLWVGGWGFVKPPVAAYEAAEIVLIAGVVAVAALYAVRKKRIGDAAIVLPLMTAIVVFLIALAWHLLASAIGAVKAPGSVTVGPGGWYLDEIRAMEAGVISFFAAAATTRVEARIVARVLTLLCAIAIALGTIFLMLPHWAGEASHAIGWDGYRAAIDAAPVRLFVALPLIIAAGWALALLGALKLAGEPGAVRV